MSRPPRTGSRRHTAVTTCLAAFAALYVGSERWMRVQGPAFAARFDLVAFALSVGLLVALLLIWVWIDSDAP